MRQSWTDDRLDDFRGEVNRRFDAVDRRFDRVDQRFEAVDKRFDRVDRRIDDLGRHMDARLVERSSECQGAIVQLQRTMFQAAVAVVVALLTGAAAIAATQL